MFFGERFCFVDCFLRYLFLVERLVLSTVFLENVFLVKACFVDRFLGDSFLVKGLFCRPFSWRMFFCERFVL